MWNAQHAIDAHTQCLPVSLLACLLVLQSLVEFYGVEASFPLTTHLITRSLETTYPKRLYYVSHCARARDCACTAWTAVASRGLPARGSTSDCASVSASCVWVCVCQRCGSQNQTVDAKAPSSSR